MTDTDHKDCAALIKRIMASKGIEVQVSDRRPGMKMPAGFCEVGLTCPHGIAMWAEPTVEQRLQWAKDKVL